VLTIKIYIPWKGQTEHSLLRKGFIKSRSKYEIIQLAKVEAEDELGLHSLFDYYQHMIELILT